MNYDPYFCAAIIAAMIIAAVSFLRSQLQLEAQQERDAERSYRAAQARSFAACEAVARAQGDVLEAEGRELAECWEVSG